jgi:outer membrane receptor for ferrienterochelin and colicins
MRTLVGVVCMLLPVLVFGQPEKAVVFDLSTGMPVAGAGIFVSGQKVAVSNDNGEFFLADSSIVLVIAADGFVTDSFPARLNSFYLEPIAVKLEEVVVSGTLKAVSRTESAVPVLVYNSAFFKCNPTPSVFDALQNVNGVRPQLNCNICNTGDIHINGLEGPYTMVLIDGLPLVSGLSTVYGLSGIPQALIDRVEVVKGPASALYGSEAVGGLINIITVAPEKAPVFSADAFGTSWGEITTDLSAKMKVGKKAQSLIGVNHFSYSRPVDNNGDGFTDVTLQDRISVFNKWSFRRKDEKLFTIAGRYVYEDRRGGQLNYGRKFRGGDSIYGESIYTARWELFGTWALPVKESIVLQASANGHYQNSAYGTLLFDARQYVFFAQLIWNRRFGKSDLMVGTPFRYTFYDDNTVVTAVGDSSGTTRNSPSVQLLPGIFVQDEIHLTEQARFCSAAVLITTRFMVQSLRRGQIINGTQKTKASSFAAGSATAIAWRMYSQKITPRLQAREASFSRKS